MTMHNIEKSAFRRGQYVGYGGGKVWHIRKTNSTYGNWIAWDRDNEANPVYAFRLKDMSDKLAALPPHQKTRLIHTLYRCA